MRGRQASWPTMAVYGIFGIVVAGGLATLLGMAAVRIACGGGGRPGNILAGLQLAIGGSAAGYAAPIGCAAPVTVARVLDLLAVALLVALAVAATLAWVRFRRSDRPFIRELRLRDGLARPREIRRYASERAVLRRAGALRPGLAQATPAAVGWRVGRAHGQDVYVPIDDAIVVESAPRSVRGEGFLVSAILDWDGPLITTSTRSDILTATMPERERRGQVTVFDPQEISGIRSTLRISLLAGCQDPLVAERRGRAIVVGTAGGASVTSGESTRVASSALSRLLHAAAVSGSGLDALARWGSSPRLATEAVSLLAEHGAAGWAESLEAIITGDEGMLDSAWLGVADAVRPLSIPAIRRAMTPGGGEQFDAGRFLAAPNTLYLIGTGAGAGSVGGFLAAVLDDVVETAHRTALTSPGGRLPQPLALILDEVASMFSWSALPRVMADGGAIGISTVVAPQTLSPAETVWSRAEADAIWSAGTAKLLFGGASDIDRLRDVESLLGQRRPRSADASPGAREERVPVITVDEIRRMPEAIGLLAHRDRRGILLELRGWTERRDAAGERG